LIPTARQWNRWSLPSKLTAIGCGVGVLSLLVTIGFRAIDWAIDGASGSPLLEVKQLEARHISPEDVQGVAILNELDVRRGDRLSGGNWLVRLSMSCSRAPVIGELPLEIRIGTQWAKIVSLRVKSSARNRVLDVTTSLPSVRWNFDVVQRLESLSWPLAPDVQASEYVLYRSLVPDTAFGRQSIGTFAEPTFGFDGDPLRDRLTYYFRPAAVYSDGRESDLGPVVAYPDVVGLAPIFDETCYTDSVVEGMGIRLKVRDEFVVDSFAAAKRQGCKHVIGELTANRDDSGIKVLNAGDLEFLRGKVRVAIANGVAHGETLEFVLLAQGVRHHDVNPTVQVVGRPDVEVSSQVRFRSVSGSASLGRRAPMKSETPERVRAHPMRSGVILSWDETIPVEKVTVFREILGEGGVNVRKLIHEGPPRRCPFYCIPDLGRKASDNAPIDTSSRSRAMAAWTPEGLKTIAAPPSPITDLRRTQGRGGQRSGDDSPHVMDVGLSPDRRYRYTLFFESGSAGPSIPVFVEASPTPPSCAGHCYDSEWRERRRHSN